MGPELQARIDWLVAEEKELTWLLQTGMNMQAAAEFDRRMQMFQDVKAMVLRDLEARLHIEEALWTALEARLGRPPIDQEDIITQEDVTLALSMVRTLRQG